MKSLCVAAMGAIDLEVLTVVEQALGSWFRAPVRRLPLPEPDFAFDAARGQYGSVPVLRHLVGSRPAYGAKLLGLTVKDLFIPMLTFVFGQAQLAGDVAVVSLARLSQEFYGMPSDRALLAARARKEALHETGHMFGLVHCRERTCVMSLATNVRHLDAKGLGFCASCAQQVEQRSIGRSREV